MQLTIYTDYALRTLMYLGANGGRPVPATEVAAAFRISANHLAKVAKDLVRGGYVRSHRGRTGGLELAMPPSKINIGQVVRFTETLDLLECFDRATSTCPLTGACKLERTLHEAQAAFLAVLDRTTLADLVGGTASWATRLAAVPRPALRGDRARRAPVPRARRAGRAPA